MSPDIQHSKLIKQLNHQDLTLQKCEFIGSKLGLDLPSSMKGMTNLRDSQEKVRHKSLHILQSKPARGREWNKLKWKNHFHETKGDIGMLRHEKEEDAYSETESHPYIFVSFKHLEVKMYFCSKQSSIFWHNEDVGMGIWGECMSAGTGVGLWSQGF